MHFDVIIIGAGPAGCVLANRLSADHRRRVLLVEAGPDYPPGTEPEDILDSFAGRAYYNPNYTWQNVRVHLKPVPHNQPDLAATRRYETARLVGGGSSINGMMANRGIPADYDEWAELGATGWNWSGVLPYFRKLERDLQFSGPLHGNDGPIPIRRLPAEVWPEFTRRIVDILKQQGIPYVDDQNGQFDESFFPIAISNENDRRVSAAIGYLTSEVRRRTNLTIWPEATAERLRFHDSRVTGVSIRSRGVLSEVTGEHFVLCGGAIHSPALLLRSGIGPAQHLRDHGIVVVADRRGVGENLQDHPAVSVTGYLRQSARLQRHLRRQMFVAMRYSSNASGCDPLDMYMVAINQAGWHPLGHRLGSLMTWLNRTYSKGRVRLASPDPDTAPRVEFGLLSDSRDLVRLSGAVRYMAALFGSPQMASAVTYAFPTSYSERVRSVGRVTSWNYIQTLALGTLLDVVPFARNAVIDSLVTQGVRLGDLLNDEAKLTEWVRDNAIGAWHASCSCRMGPAGDPDSVVDPEGRVYGVANLRLADASIMPFVPRANTNIPVMMIGEKIADAILQREP